MNGYWLFTPLLLPLFFGGLALPWLDALIPGLHLLEGGQVSAGSILNWFKRNFGQGLEAEAAANQEAKAAFTAACVWQAVVVVLVGQVSTTGGTEETVKVA